MLPTPSVNSSAPAPSLLDGQSPSVAAPNANNGAAPASGGSGGETLTREQVAEMHEKFRTVKHSACNALAVMMALSEMAERNPAYVEKLTKTVLSKSPQMVAELREFDDDFRALLNALPE